MDKIMMGYMHKPNNDANNPPTIIKSVSILPLNEYALKKGLNECKQKVELAKKKIKGQSNE